MIESEEVGLALVLPDDYLDSPVAIYTAEASTLLWAEFWLIFLLIL